MAALNNTALDVDYNPPPPIVIPKMSRRHSMNRSGDSKQKFSKSRNGCVTCKTRRVKCDETKPACEQCARRRITCGGYKLDVRWKEAPEPKRASPQRRKSRPVVTSEGLSGQQSPTVASGPFCPLPPTNEGLIDVNVMDTSSDPLSLNLPTPRSLEYLLPDMNSALSPTVDRGDHESNMARNSIHDAGGNLALNMMDPSHDFWDFDPSLEDFLRFLPTTPLDTTFAADHPIALPSTPRAQLDDTDRIALLFHQQTCRTLSMQEAGEYNPWRVHIWPMAREHPALYHAIAALTCFCVGKQQPHLQLEGNRHLQHSTQLLSQYEVQNDVSLEAILATTIAIAFTEPLDPEHGFKGMHRIHAAGDVVQKLLSRHDRSMSRVEDQPCLRFLFRTWMYMDVLARFTCNESSSSDQMDFTGFDIGALPDDLDPLMGYATTLFPTMRRVANLINKIRVKNPTRNSPAHISQAMELKRIIEDWTLPIDLEAIDDPSPNMTDAIQTAEAYRWSTLAMLYQAVPELPNLTSYGELSQKILIFLATVPLSSNTVIGHIFPLMVAGCDAIEEEDRDFVRERWNAMSARMITGVVGECLKVTEEVWTRRDDFLRARNLPSPLDGRFSDLQQFTGMLEGDALKAGSSLSRFSAKGGRKASDFPISAAFKRGVDPLTRSGCNDYTVRGKLHWLGVMDDWGMRGLVLLG